MFGSQVVINPLRNWTIKHGRYIERLCLSGTAGLMPRGDAGIDVCKANERIRTLMVDVKPSHSSSKSTMDKMAIPMDKVLIITVET
jgi:hypothetical protein